jgi:glycosyltransferase involved in cell wall biosynthesis
MASSRPCTPGAGPPLRSCPPFFSPGYNAPLGSVTRFVFTLHDLNHLCVPENSNFLKRAYYRHVIRPACRKAEFVLTVSDYSRQQISSWAEIDEQKIVNVGNGVGEPFTSSGDAHRCDRPYFLYVGSYKPHKNLLRLLQAYAASRSFREIKILLTGFGCQSLHEEARRLGIADSIEFVGIVSDRRLAKLYRGALALLFPSLYEGFGLPPLEAMACGTPVLTSNICSLPEVAGDAAVQVDPHEVESIAAGIKQIAEDSGLRKSLSAKGLCRAQEFTWSATASKTRAVLHRALQNAA